MVNYKDTEPFLTIGIASYNYSQYLYSAFEAIKKQAFSDYEILYCDDGSTDDSVEVIKKIIKNNPEMNIRLVQGKNSGVMGNKNRIIENANGRYLMLCDADDKMLPNCLEVLCELAKSTDADQVVAAFEQVDGDGKVLQIQEVPDNLSRWTWGVHHATLYKMQIIKDNRLKFDEKCYPDDVYFNMIFHEKSKTIEYVNKVVYDWNMHADSTSAIKENDDKWHGYPVLESALKYIKPIASEYKDKEYLEIEYMAIKIYCMANLYRKNTSYKGFLDDYKKMNSLMLSYFPNYKNNAYVKKSNAGGIVRKYTGQIIWGFILAERVHVINAALWGYWIISKFKDFVV